MISIGVNILSLFKLQLIKPKCHWLPRNTGSKENNTFRETAEHLTILFQGLNLGRRMWICEWEMQISYLQILTTTNPHGLISSDAWFGQTPEEPLFQSKPISSPISAYTVKTPDSFIWVWALSQHLASPIFTTLPHNSFGLLLQHFYPNYGSGRYEKRYIHILLTQHTFEANYQGTWKARSCPLGSSKSSG